MTLRTLAISSLISTACWMPLVEAGLPDDPHFEPYQLAPAPEPSGLVLEKGDRLAICGDSITEQKRYSLIMEVYLTACTPELQVTCRQFGWGGETAGGFFQRMENDVLRFKPDVATTCYGMNDFRYVPFEQGIADEYVKNQTAVVRAFKDAGTKVVVGSPGIIDGVPGWQQNPAATPLNLSQSLAEFRNLDIALAAKEKTGFADVFEPMLIADWKAKKEHGPEFKVAGKDGVHPGWAGHLPMAYAFLKGLGLDGNLGEITVVGDRATAKGGHEVKGMTQGTLSLVSSRFPFSAGPGDPGNDDSLRAGLALVPFDSELNRFTLKVERPTAERYAVTWGQETHEFSAEQLEQGINLAAEFVEHPLLEPFRKVWAAAERKQNYETRQIKDMFHGPEANADMEAVANLTERVHQKLVAELADSMQPVEHQITLKALP
ncbi:lysophospholipase L1-like esterase [Haloferula luteola]|uniref:Lysophospholipase L1-like esterase n=1 Tax=Haloferula luteola TaxID=595692 RepID=A0A840V7U1_9BACT|nr:SGNH/GDSL hydrolase family protein [Haloferula luteola]MBB5349829.1 lysophospholipase L1-like esterase [Haloferula luteola]